MTSTTSKKSDIEALAEALDGTNLQRAEAIVNLVDNRTAKTIKEFSHRLGAIIDQQHENIEAAKAEGSPEAGKLTNPATRAVKEANEAVKAAESEPTDDEKAKQAEEKVEKAAQAVSKTESDLEKLVLKHEDEIYREETGILARLKKNEADISRLEKNYSGLNANVEGLWTDVQANARAIASGGGAGVFERAARVALTVFGVVTVLYALIGGLSPLDWRWENQLALPLGAGALAGWAALLWGGDPSSSSASAESEASIRSRRGSQPRGGEDAGTAIFTPARASASAHASSH